MPAFQRGNLCCRTNRCHNHNNNHINNNNNLNTLRHDKVVFTRSEVLTFSRRSIHFFEHADNFVDAKAFRAKVLQTWGEGYHPPPLCFY